MKLKQATMALAAGVLTVALGLADASGHGYGGGGRGGFGGGGMGMGPRGGMMGMGPRSMGPAGFSHHGAPRSFGTPYGSRFNGQSFHPRMGRPGNANFGKGYPASRYMKAAPHTFTSAAGRQPGFHPGGNKNFDAGKNNWHPGSNSQLRHAAFTHPNGFYGHNFKYGQNHHYWHDRWGRWYGYRWYGAVFWPYWFGDYYSYAFWPYDYYDTYWGYGPDAIMWGAFWPCGEVACDDNSLKGDGAYSGEIYRPYRKGAQDAPADVSPAVSAETCTGFAPGVSDLPIQQLEKIVGGNEEQRAALNELKEATLKAADSLKQSCSSEAPLTPVSRLDAMQRRLQAIGEANDAVKGPLVHLYSLLSDAQKQQLAALAQSNVKRVQPARAKDVNIAELCSNQAAFTNVPAERIAGSMKLTSAQKEELEKLKAASAKASDELKASCPASAPDALDARLDAARQRVTALIQAVDTVRPAVRDFYATLSDEQKAALSVQPARETENRG